MANKIILKSGETIPTVDNLEELEPGIDKTTNKLYTKINGQIIPLNDTSWESIQNKPTTFPPSEHTHGIIDIENLESEITLIKDTIEEQASQIENINTDIEDLNNNKMDSPNSQTDSSATGYFLKQSNSNQGHWFYLQEASQNSTGLLSSSGYNLFLNKIGATNTGSYGQFLMRNNNSSSPNQGTWTDLYVPEYNFRRGTYRPSGLSTASYAYLTLGEMLILQYNIPINSISVSIALGSLYRSNTPYRAGIYKYPIPFTKQPPSISMTFYSTNNQSAFVWPNPDANYGGNGINDFNADVYTSAPPVYLVRPISATNVSGELQITVVGTFGNG